MRTRPGARCFASGSFAIAAASEGRLGGTRALAALRLILSACHATVIPNQLALSFADEAYDDMDRLKHPADIEGAESAGAAVDRSLPAHDVR